MQHFSGCKHRVAGAHELLKQEAVRGVCAVAQLLTQDDDRGRSVPNLLRLSAAELYDGLQMHRR